MHAGPGMPLPALGMTAAHYTILCNIQYHILLDTTRYYILYTIYYTLDYTIYYLLCYTIYHTILCTILQAVHVGPGIVLAGVNERVPDAQPRYL